jgi:hypothetical protein
VTVILTASLQRERMMWSVGRLGRGSLTLMAIATLVGISPAEGQGVESVREGARVRLAFDETRMSGILAHRGRDTLWVRVGGPDTLVTVPLAQLRRLEVSRERQSNAGHLALAGFLIGAIPGMLAGAACDCGNPGAAVVFMGAFTGGLGAALGAGLGATSRHDVWEIVR